jgi:hypothetical protein
MKMDGIIIREFDQLENFALSCKGWLFRGQENPDWELQTSLERACRRLGVPQLEYEQHIVREFQRHAHAYLDRTPKIEDTVEWLALMQHYGAPTRFLDFTSSFWIALHIAYETAENDCAVWALNPDTLGSDSGKDFNEILRKNIYEDLHIEDILYQNVPFFMNERLAIQKGTFVFSLSRIYSFHQLLVRNQKEYRKITIDRNLFGRIREKLNAFNCNSRVLLPGIDGYAQYFQNHTY